MSLLDWIKAGRKGKFRGQGFSLRWEKGHYLMQTPEDPFGIGAAFENLKEVCYYLGHEAHEIEGESDE